MRHKWNPLSLTIPSLLVTLTHRLEISVWHWSVKNGRTLSCPSWHNQWPARVPTSALNRNSCGANIDLIPCSLLVYSAKTVLAWNSLTVGKEKSSLPTRWYKISQNNKQIERMYWQMYVFWWHCGPKGWRCRCLGDLNRSPLVPSLVRSWPCSIFNLLRQACHPEAHCKLPHSWVEKQSE